MATPTPQPISTEPIGLIGLGLMGQAIAQRLLSHGQPVFGFDLLEVARANLQSQGGAITDNPSQIFRSCPIVILSLPSHNEVAQVLEANQPYLESGHLLIDTSTGDPSFAAAAAHKLRFDGISLVDAAISGNSDQLGKGEAVFLVGSTPEAFAVCEPVLALMAGKILHCGPVGSGAQMKLVSNLVLGLNRAALAEGLSYARSQGLNLETTLKTLKETMAYSRIMDTKGENMIRRDYHPRAKLSQHHKDVTLIVESAQQTSAWVPMTLTHKVLLEKAMELGMGDWDNSALFELFLRAQPGESGT